MGNKRKTIGIKALIDEVNRRNRVSHGSITAEMRKGSNSLLESVLHNAGVYSGFGYLDAKDVPDGEKPGIIWNGNTVNGDGETFIDTNSRCPHSFPDESRRHYYTDASLTAKRRKPASKPTRDISSVLDSSEIELIRDAIGPILASGGQSFQGIITGMHNGRVPNGCGDIVGPVRRVRNSLTANPEVFASLFKNTS